MIELFIIYIGFGSAESDPQCGPSILNCESCFSTKAKCGWCNENNECYVGTLDGPLNHTCADWTFKFDMKCHLQSVNSTSFGCRIGMIVFSSIVAFGTLVFWVCIFPSCCSPKTESETNSEYQSH